MGGGGLGGWQMVKECACKQEMKSVAQSVCCYYKFYTSRKNPVSTHIMNLVNLD